MIMLQFNLFPGGKRRVVTFSYDDGSDNDERLATLFSKYGVKATFHLNSSRFFQKSADELAEIKKRYEGHEIACHTVNHGWPSRMPAATATAQTLEDRKFLEKIAGYPVRGMSYPSGSYNETVISAMLSCGIVYSRTTSSHMGHKMPQNWMEWNPTCHHRDAMPLVAPFMETLDSEWKQPLFYIWGHSHELRCEEDWAYMEKLVSLLSGSDKIWYATNIEIYDYMQALSMLRISADEKIIENPTASELWVEIDKKKKICIPSGKTVFLD